MVIIYFTGEGSKKLIIFLLLDEKNYKHFSFFLLLYGYTPGSSKGTNAPKVLERNANPHHDPKDG